MGTDIALIVAPFAIIVLAFAIWRRLARKRLVAERESAASELQAFLTIRIQSLRALLDDSSIPSVEAQARADRIVAEMESRNTHGNLDALIADTREYLHREIGNGRVA